MSVARTALLLTAMFVVAAPSAYAQRYRRSSSEPHFGSLEVSAGGIWLRAVDFGEIRAEELRNPATGGTPLVLFVTNSRIGSVAGAQLRLGVHLTRSLIAEGGLRYSRPVVRTGISQDFEGAAEQVATETMSEYLLDGSVVLDILHAADGRVVPFVQGGAGQIRDVHENGELVQTGTEYHAGGGVKLWFGRFGIRGEVGASSRTGGFDLNDTRRTIAVVGGSLIVRF